MTGYRTILAAVDLTDSAGHVLAQAAELAARYQAVLHLVHVVEYLPPIVVGDEPVPAINMGIDETEMAECAMVRLQELASQQKLTSCEQYVEVGTPKIEIIELAEKVGADLIVIGSHGRHGISRLLGSTANAVLHHTPCDVLAVRLKS